MTSGLVVDNLQARGATLQGARRRRARGCIIKWLLPEWSRTSLTSFSYPLLLRDPFTVLMETAAVAPEMLRHVLILAYYVCLARTVIGLVYVLNKTRSHSATRGHLRRRAHVLHTFGEARSEKLLYAFALPFLRRAAILCRSVLPACFPTPPAVGSNVCEYNRLLTMLNVPALSDLPNQDTLQNALSGWSAHYSHSHATSQLNCGVVLDFPAVYRLARLPLVLDNAFGAQDCALTCQRCSAVPVDAAICLLCGTACCMQSDCCRDEENDRACFLDVAAPNNGTFSPPPYLDAHGEVDISMRRGRWQYLHFAHWEEVRKTWMAHGVPTVIARRLEAALDSADGRRLSAEDPSDVTPKCGLICRNWLPRSRFHIFSYAKIHSESRLKTFLEITEASSLDLPSLLRALVLSPPSDGFDLEQLAKLPGCPNLTTLQLSARGKPGASQLQALLETQLAFLARCPSLSLFEVICTRDTISVRTIADVFASLPSLQAFRLTGPLTITPADLPSTLPFPAQLHRLDISVVDGAGLVFAWFLSLPVLPTLKSLTLNKFDDVVTQDPSLVEYFRRAGPGFVFLSLQPVWEDDEPSGILKYATKLRDLQLHFQEAFKVPRILATLPSSNLETITIHLVGWSPSPEDCRLIDEALANPRLSGLKKFSFEGLRGGILYGIYARIPLANARGILIE
ncbi:hypothetical protein FB451DRAFT_1413889 [Mycena latifolia]|nr:hypothetical protein FB451DRAFT_1413889 [Mycena latifolia]